MVFASGIGDGGDGCCVLLVLAGLAVVGWAAIRGAAEGSIGAVIFSFVIAGLVGTVVIREAVRHELRDTDDSRGVHAMLWGFVWWWAVSLCVPVGAAAVLLFRRRKPDAAPDGPKPET